MTSFDSALTYVLSNEGGLVENPNDPGGITKYGISLRFLKSIPEDLLKHYGLIVGKSIDKNDIKSLTLNQASEIYRQEFWCHIPFELIFDQSLVNYIFDMCVNMGIAPAVKCVQRSCWSFFTQKDIIHDDGIMGDKTIALLNKMNWNIMPALRSERAAYYRLLAEQNPHEKEFLEGWLNRAYGTSKN